MTDPITKFLYLLPLLLIFGWYVRRKFRRHSASVTLRDTNVEAGLTEPSSLHPIVDHKLCVGCGACVSACPEGNVLGLVNGIAELINATHCIGHSACKPACPFDAITLVFGTEKRGMDIPTIKPTFETNLSGVYIAGELGGMGLIRNACEQGRQAMENICKHRGVGEASGDTLDVLIVGAGPAGITASLGAMEAKLKSVTIEQESFGGTVSHFPRGKLVMTAPVKLPIVGNSPFNETTKEKLLEYWEDIREKTGLEIQYLERLEDIAPEGDHYRVKTSKNSYLTKIVLLCLGRRGTPRKLGVPGEDVSKVVYRLIDPAQYAGQHVLVVGGGDSALEAATSIADEDGTTVALSYRSDAFSRAKEKNRQKVAQAEEEGRLTVLFKSNVTEVTETQVILDQKGETITLDNDAIIVSAGGILPTPFLKNIGIEVETKHGQT